MRTPVLFICLAAFTLSNAQMVQKCCGTGNSTFLLGNLSSASHSQCIYAPSDLTGAQAGDINRLYYRYGGTGVASGNTLNNFMVRFTQTLATAFSSNLFFTGLDTVYMTTSFTIPPGTTGDWFAIDLDTPFTFDETLTLIVDLSFTGSATTNFGTASTSMSGRKLYWSDNISPTGESVVSSWQDVGFDLILPTMVAAEDQKPFSLAPNPSSGMLQLTLAEPASSPITLQVLDVSGKNIVERIVNPGTIATMVDLGPFPQGIYMIRLSDADGIIHSIRAARE